MPEPQRVEIAPPAVPGYELLRELGRGGFGAVFLARRAEDGVALAIKIAHDDPLAAARLAREADALRAIGPPTVPRLHGEGVTEDGRRWLAMEHVAHPTLAERLAGLEAPLGLEPFAAWARAALDAVSAVHGRGLVHRDLKPENIFLGGAPLGAKLIDFGLVRGAEAIGPSDLTALAPIVGTAEYMAPEQCDPRGAVHLRADLYALGIIFFELLTGRPPFTGAPADVREAHLSRRPPRPSQHAPVPEALEAVVLRCLAKDPERRFGSAGALREALDAALLSSGGAQPGAPPEIAAPSPAASQGAEARGWRQADAALVFLLATSDPAAVQEVAARHGAALASAAGERCALAVEGDGAAQDVERALRLGQALLRDGHCRAALIDHAAVARQPRPGGATRFMSPLFRRDDRYPDGPEGLLLTPAAGRALPTLRVEPAEGTPWLRAILHRSDTGTGATPTPATLIDAPLVGRDEELAAAAASACEAIAARVPALLTVIAEPGYGKSRLAVSLVRELRARQVGEVIDVTAPDPAGGEANAAARLILRRALDLPERAPEDDQGRALLAERLGPELAADIGGAIALTLGWISDAAPELAALRAAPGALRDAATRALGEVLKRRAAERPTLVVLDDAHFADAVALDALEYATLSEWALPLWVAVLARPGLEAARPHWGSRAGRHASLRLGPLSREAAEALCAELLKPAENVPADAVARLVERTQGIPLLLVELVRGLKDSGVLRRHKEYEAWYVATDAIDDLPELPLVEWLAERELAALPPALAMHARLCALLGPELSEPEVEGVLAELEREAPLAEAPLDARVGVRRLVSRGLLARGPQGRLRFRHALVRDAVARGIPAELGARIHRAALALYRTEAARRGGAADLTAKLAHHAAAAGLSGEAGALYLELADEALVRHAYLDAEAAYTRALVLLGPEQRGERLQARRGRGTMRYRLGRHDDALEDFAEARELAQALGDTEAEIEILLDEATALDWALQCDRARERVEQASSLAHGELSPLIEARLLLGQGRSYWRAGDLDRAIEALQVTVGRAEVLGDDGYETLVAALLSLEFTLAGAQRFDEAERAAARVIALCESRGDRLHLAASLANRLQLSVGRRDLDRAVSDIERERQIAREIGVVSLEYGACYNLGLLFYLAGRTDQATPYIDRALALEARPIGIDGRPRSLVLKARLLAYQGRDEEARRALAALQRHEDAARAAGQHDRMIDDGDRVLVDMVDRMTREPDDDAWEALRERCSRFCYWQEPIEVVEMQALAEARRGARSKARRLLEEALALAERIPNIMEGRLRADMAELAQKDNEAGA